jgi:hypothetical protein
MESRPPERRPSRLTRPSEEAGAETGIWREATGQEPPARVSFMKDAACTRFRELLVAFHWPVPDPRQLTVTGAKSRVPGTPQSYPEVNFNYLISRVHSSAQGPIMQEPTFTSTSTDHIPLSVLSPGRAIQLTVVCLRYNQIFAARELSRPPDTARICRIGRFEAGPQLLYISATGRQTIRFDGERHGFARGASAARKRKGVCAHGGRRGLRARHGRGSVGLWPAAWLSADASRGNTHGRGRQRRHRPQEVSRTISGEKQSTSPAVSSLSPEQVRSRSATPHISAFAGVIALRRAASSCGASAIPANFLVERNVPLDNRRLTG